MATILSFPETDKEEPLEVVWVCDCGSASFHIHDTGAVECVLCGEFHTGEVTYVIPKKEVVLLPDDFEGGDDV